MELGTVPDGIPNRKNSDDLQQNIQSFKIEHHARERILGRLILISWMGMLDGTLIHFIQREL